MSDGGDAFVMKMDENTSRGSRQGGFIPSNNLTIWAAHLA